jgi:GNAT superfamily N-acetyltransferase
MATSAAVGVRVATADDVEAIVDTLTTAFFDDPLWGPAFPDVSKRAGQASALWRLFATSSLRYSWTLVTENVESAAIWIPPGGDELTEQEQNGFEEFLLGISDRKVADGVLAISDQFEAARPGEPHFYLSLLATHDRHRGAGLGMGLLRESLRRVDAQGAAAYLESCNPANNARYESVGFTRRDEITAPSGQIVTTMWRPAAGDPLLR